MLLKMYIHFSPICMLLISVGLLSLISSISTSTADGKKYNDEKFELDSGNNKVFNKYTIATLSDSSRSAFQENNKLKLNGNTKYVYKDNFGKKEKKPKQAIFNSEFDENKEYAKREKQQAKENSKREKQIAKEHNKIVKQQTKLVKEQAKREKKTIKEHQKMENQQTKEYVKREKQMAKESAKRNKQQNNMLNEKNFIQKQMKNEKNNMPKQILKEEIQKKLHED